jgi:hypothetical protein
VPSFPNVGDLGCGEQALEPFGQAFFALTAKDDLGLAVGRDEHERGLTHHAERGPDIAGLVVDVFELGDAATIDESVDGVDVIATGDTDDVDPIAVLFFDRCDRRGFANASTSPRSPEPQHCWGTQQIVEGDLPPLGCGQHDPGVFGATTRFGGIGILVSGRRRCRRALLSRSTTCSGRKRENEQRCDNSDVTKAAGHGAQRYWCTDW